MACALCGRTACLPARPGAGLGNQRVWGPAQRTRSMAKSHHCRQPPGPSVTTVLGASPQRSHAAPPPPPTAQLATCCAQARSAALRSAELWPAARLKSTGLACSLTEQPDACAWLIVCSVQHGCLRSAACPSAHQLACIKQTNKQTQTARGGMTEGARASARLATSNSRAVPSAPAASSARPSRAQARQRSAGSPASEKAAARLNARWFHSARRPAAGPAAGAPNEHCRCMAHTAGVPSSARWLCSARQPAAQPAAGAQLHDHARCMAHEAGTPARAVLPQRQAACYGACGSSSTVLQMRALGQPAL